MRPGTGRYPLARRVIELDVDGLPAGAVHRLLVEVVEDALGGAIRIPVLVAKGSRPGPVVGLTAALHGNELNGIPVLHALFGSVDPTRLRGAIVGVVVANVPGLMLHRREFLDGVDLNHKFPGRPDGNVHELYAHRLVDRLIRHFDYLVDLHTASFGRVNCLYTRSDLSHPRTARMAALLRPEIMLHNPASDGTLRGTAMDLEIPAVTLEIGNPHRFQRKYIQQAIVGIRALLGDLQLLPRRRTAVPEPVVCSHSAWVHTREGGFLHVLPEVTERVREGQVVAELTNAFGDITARYEAPGSGIVIGRSVDPVGQAGARILHLGLEATGDEGFCLDFDQEPPEDE